MKNEKLGRDEARPSHIRQNIVRDMRFGRDGLCPVHYRGGFATASFVFVSIVSFVNNCDL